MCLVDTKEIKRAVAVEDNLSDLVVWVNIIIKRLVDEDYSIRLDNDPFEYPALEAYRKVTL
jgi:hypothetical protein